MIGRSSTVTAAQTRKRAPSTTAFAVADGHPKSMESMTALTRRTDRDEDRASALFAPADVRLDCAVAPIAPEPCFVLVNKDPLAPVPPPGGSVVRVPRPHRRHAYITVMTVDIEEKFIPIVIVRLRRSARQNRRHRDPHRNHRAQSLRHSHRPFSLPTRVMEASAYLLRFNCYAATVKSCTTARFKGSDEERNSNLRTQPVFYWI